MTNEDFYYYLHLSKTDSPEDIESFFNNGLKSAYYYSLHSTLSRVDENDLKQFGLEKIILNCLNNTDTYKSVVVVKIPKRYFSDKMHRDGKFDIAIPMFREYQEDGAKWNAIFTPKLIQGIYCKNIDKSFTNPNFCPVFDPSGNQFSDEQITNFDFQNNVEWRKFANDRKKCPFQQLYSGDTIQHTWDNIVSHYSKLYGIAPKQMINYVMPDDEKSLFDGKHI